MNELDTGVEKFECFVNTLTNDGNNSTTDIQTIRPAKSVPFGKFIN
jgi:hypothetical protein